ncbi:MAG: glycosyltransferase [Sandaracinus sp.]
MRRPLVVSNRWVPSGTGTPIVLYELFRHFPPSSVTVFCGPGVHPASSLTLPFETRRLTLPKVDRYVYGAYRVLGKRALPLVRAALWRVIQREKPTALYAHYPDAVFVTAAALAAERAGIPLVVYFDILWEGNDEPGLAKRYEHRVVRTASRRFAITEDYCEYLGQKHGVPFELMPHVLPTAQAELVIVPREERTDAIHIGGNVYVNMNLDAVQRLHRVMARRPAPPPLEIYGFTPRTELEKWGIRGDWVKTGTVQRHELLALQRRSRVLYLPEAFESPTPQMIRYNFPTKALEYMLTGTPILVHAPADSYLARNAREHGWGLLVDRPDDEALAAALQRLEAGGPEVDAMVHRAFEFARSRDGAVWSAKLMGALGVTPR